MDRAVCSKIGANPMLSGQLKGLVVSVNRPNANLLRPYYTFFCRFFLSVILILSVSYVPALAEESTDYISEIPLSDESLAIVEDGKNLPPEYFEVSKLATSPDEIPVIESGYVRLVRVPVSTADRNGVIDAVSDAANTVWRFIIDSALSTSMAKDSFTLYFAQLWYEYPDKQGDVLPIYNTRETNRQLSDFGSYESFTNYFFANYTYRNPFEFRTLEDSPYAMNGSNGLFEFGRWYDYFTGTSSGGGVDEDGTTYTLTTIYAGSWAGYNAGTWQAAGYIGPSGSTSLVDWGTSGQGVQGPSQLTLKITQENAQKISDELDLHPDYQLLIVLGSESGTSSTASYDSYRVKYCIVDPSALSLGDNTSSGNYGHRLSASTYYVATGRSRRTIVNGTVVDDSLSNFTATTNRFDILLRYNHAPYCYWFGGGGSGGGGGSIEPVYPVRPTPTTPETPTITVNPPTVIEHPVNQTTTTTVDLQPILDAIRLLNENLTASIDGLVTALENCCENMRALLDGWAQYFGEWWESIWQELLTVNRWLEGIYYKTGGGTSSKPDYTAQPDDTLTWLDELLARLFESLPDGLQDILTTLAELRGVFPFSIPWDIGIMLGLFAADPVAPVFDLPYPYAYADGAAVYATLHVDLSGWEPAAYLCRRGLFIVFGGWLAFNTKRLLGLVEVD